MNTVPDSATPPTDDRERQALVLRCVQEVAGALHPHLRAEGAIGLDSAFEADLGLDSLSRAELLARLERACGVELPAQTLSQCETPRDLVRALRGVSAALPEHAPPPPPPAPESRGRVAEPRAASTLIEVLEWHAAATPEREHLRYLADDGSETPLCYGELLERSRCVAGGLVQRGLEPGQSVAVMLPTGIEYFLVFTGILLAGGVPVPIYPPARLSMLEDHCRRHAGILANAQARLMVTFDQARPVGRLLASLVDGLSGVVSVSELAAAAPLAAIARPGADATAFLQYTSGSTGQPKGVVLSHANLLANVRIMGRALTVSDEDVFVSWLPLYHDMGLIGAWLGSLYWGMRLVVMSPLTFLARPVRWLQAITHHRGTLSAGPNFAYELCLKRIDDDALATLDLSSWRYAFNGAEPVSADTLERFAERFAPVGLRREVLTPVYGLAEASLGIAFPPPGRGPLVDRISRSRLMRDGRAEPVTEDDADGVALVACGRPLPGYQIRVVDESGRELPERREGRLQFQGPSTTSGYFRNPEATRALFDGDWLESGDLAYIAGGDIFITGRVKDVIIRAGRNLYPYELEQAVGDIEGVRRGCVAVFAARAAAGEPDRLVVVAETRERDEAARERIRTAITAAATSLLDAAPDDIVLAPPHSVLKTSSGKIRRAATRERYERGELGAGQRALWRQVVSLALSGAGRRLRRGAARAAELTFAGRFWLALASGGLLAAIGLLLLPGARLRFRFTSAVARVALWLAGIDIEVHGREQVTESGALVLVANHQSYLDGVVLCALAPRPFGFVVKGELRRQRLLALLLARLGCRFVERFDAARSVADAQALEQALAAGEALLFFPEGTLRRMPGLLPFRTGAFVAAIEAGAPLRTVAIRGTRSVLRDQSWFPRRAAVRVRFGPAVEAPAEGDTFARALALREAARARLLEDAGEPDLGEYLPYAELRSASGTTEGDSS